METNKEPLHVLIIDDSDLIGERLKILLNENSLTKVIGWAKNLKEGLLFSTQLKPDIIFLDIKLPDGNGLDILTQLKSNCAEVTIIVFSNFDNDFYKRKFVETGGNYFLDKSKDFSKIRDVISEIVYLRNNEPENKGFRGETPFFENSGVGIKQLYELKEKLKLSEEKLKEAEAIAHLGYWETDLIKNKMTWSDETFRILGFEPHEKATSRELFYSLVHPEDIFIVTETLRKAELAHSYYHFNYRIIRKNGELRYLYSKGYFDFDNEGKPIRIYGVVQDITDRTIAEKQIEFDHNNTEALINNTNDMMWSLDRDLNLITCNKAFYNLVILLCGKPISKGDTLLTNGFTEEQIEKWKKVYARGLSGESFTELEYSELPFKLWSEISINPIYNDNSIVGVACYTRDITASKDAEEKLRKNELRLNESQTIAKIGSWEINLKDNTQVWSDEFYNIFGIKMDEVIPTTELFLSFVHPDDIGLVNESMEKSFIKFTNSSFYFRFIPKDKSTKHGYAEWRFEFDKDNVPIRLYGIVHDVTEKKETERKVIESENRQKIFFKKTLGFLCTHDLDGNFMDVNFSGAQNLGYTPEELIGSNISKIIAPSSKKLLNDYFIKLQEEKSVTGLMRVISKNGEEHIWTYTNYLYEDGPDPYVIGSSQDITDHFRMKEELIKSRYLAQESAEVKKMAQEINLYSQKLGNSINYAKRLQDGILISEEVVKKIFRDSFIVDHPKEVISGDFYWLNIKRNKIMVALGDCTGHGVPGALLSTLGYTMLNNIVANNGLMAADDILKKLCVEWQRTFNRNNRQVSSDGMEIALCAIDYENNTIEFASMGSTIFFMRNGELIKYNGENIGISNRYVKKVSNDLENLVCYKSTFEKNDRIYLFSDGYQDQFGGVGGDEKFTKKRFCELILSIQEHSIEEQKNIIESTFKKWKGGNAQIDDVLVLGIQL